MTEVSVIIAAWNAEHTIKRCLDSIFSQIDVNFEVLVIDDCSTDGTAKIVKDNFPRAKYFKTPVNSGPSAARNFGIAQAIGTWIAIVDADDMVDKERLASLIAATEEDTDIIFDNIKILSEIGENIIKKKDFLPPSYTKIVNNINIQTYCLYNQPYKSSYLIGFLKPVIKRTFLLNNKITYNNNLRNSEDFILILESLIKGANVKYINRPFYNYIVYDNSLSGNFNPEAHLKLIDYEKTILLQNASNLDRASKKGIEAHIDSLQKAYKLYMLFETIKSMSIRHFLKILKSDWENAHFYLYVVIKSVFKKILNKKSRGS